MPKLFEKRKEKNHFASELKGVLYESRKQAKNISPEFKGVFIKQSHFKKDESKKITQKLSDQLKRQHYKSLSINLNGQEICKCTHKRQMHYYKLGICSNCLCETFKLKKN